MKLLDKYQELGIIKAGELLLTPQDAVNLVEEIAQKGILILGVDLWYYLGDQIVEDPSSLDLRNISDAKISAEVAKKFIITQLPENIVYVSLILDDE
jgi:hypothetical protein